MHHAESEWPTAVTGGVGRLLARYVEDLAVDFAFVCQLRLGRVVSCVDQSGTEGLVPREYAPLVDKIRERGALVMVDDLVTDSLTVEGGSEPLTGSFLGVGVFNEAGILTGMLLAHGLTPRSWTNRDLERAGDMAQGIASLLIIDDLRRHAERRVNAEVQARELRQQMHAISAQSASAASLPELARILVRETPGLLGADWSIVGVRHAESDWKAYLAPDSDRALGALFEGVDALGDSLFEHCAEVAGSREEITAESFTKLSEVLAGVGAARAVRLVAAPLAATDNLAMVLVCGFSADSLDLQTDYVFEELLDDVRRVVGRTAAAQTQIQAALALQRSLLPPRVPDLSGFEIGRLYNSAADHTRVGGDWYDIVQIDAVTTGFVVGDVAGHDIRSAAIMGQLRHVLASQLRDRRRPSGALTATDRYFADLAENVMATAVVMVIDQSTQLVHIALAGHPPPVLLSAGDARLIPARPGPPIGFGYGGYNDLSVPLDDGDTLIAYTDGVVEKSTGDLAEHLDEFVTALRLAEQSVPGLIAALDRHSRLGELVDDVAALVVKFMVEKSGV